MKKNNIDLVIKRIAYLIIIAIVFMFVLGNFAEMLGENLAAKG